jgi:hypothetical protein
MWKQIGPPYWDQEPVVYLLGGGPSLTGFNLDTLAGRVVVAVNNAVYRYPTAAAVVSVDTTWIESNASILRMTGYQGEMVFGVPEHDNPPDSVDATWLRWKQAGEISLISSTLHSPSTSGYAALNYVLLKRARNIVLLGYDYCRAGEHWWGNYQWSSGSDDALYSIWAAQYNSIVPVIKSLGVNVWNSNPNSRVTAFPTLPKAAFGLMA